MRKTLKTGVSLLLIAAMMNVLLSLGASAWGPSNRPTFTIANPPDYVTFNSITDNPKWGDERSFAQIKPAGTPNSEYSYGAELRPGQTYDVIAYFHNNGSVAAEGAFARVEIPRIVNGDTIGNVVFGSANANPPEVWSSITFTSGQPVELHVVSGSAKLHNFAEPVSGSTERTFDLPMELFGVGTPIGFDAMDGMLPGGNFHSGYITFQVNVPNPMFRLDTVVKIGTDGEWHRDISAVNPQIGDILRFRMYYANTGDVIQNDVVFFSELKAGLRYISNSTTIRDVSGDRSATDGITTTGINLGNFEPRAEVYVVFEAKVVGASLEAKFSVDTDNGGLDIIKRGEVNNPNPSTGVTLGFSAVVITAGVAVITRKRRGK